jgi:hypothetical protein
MASACKQIDNQQSIGVSTFKNTARSPSTAAARQRRSTDKFLSSLHFACFRTQPSQHESIEVGGEKGVRGGDTKHLITSMPLCAASRAAAVISRVNNAV